MQTGKDQVHRDVTNYFFSETVINRWNLLDQRMVETPSINAFKSRLEATGWASSWSCPLGPRPCWLHRLPVRLHKVNHKVNYDKQILFKVIL